MTFTSANASQGTVSENGGVITASLGDLASGGTTSITVIAAVASGVQGSLDNAVSVTADQFDSDTSNNSAVIATTAQLPPAVVSGVVFLDMNNDGARQSNEPPIMGVRLTLTGTDTAGNAISLNQITTPDGTYQFTVAPGQYNLVESQPIMFGSGIASVGVPALGQLVNNDEFFLQLGEADQATDFNFGETFPILSKRQYLASS